MPPPRSLLLDVDRLPVDDDPWAFELPVTDVPRLAASLAGSDGVVRATVDFARVDGVPRLHVGADVEVTLICQRCLQPMQLLLEGESQVALVENLAQADALPEDVEPVWVESRRVDLREVVEEELLLALPLVPMHEDGDDECGAAADVAGAVGMPMVAARSEGSDEDAVEGDVEPVTQKPFAELAELLKRRK
jgi:uncharacterized protein